MIIDDATGNIVDWPIEQDEAPEVQEGQTAIDQPPGYGVSWAWDPVTRGRKDLVASAPLITVGRFKLLMTQAERIAIRAAAASSPQVEDFLDLLDGFTEGVSLSDPLLVAAIGQMQAAGLLSEPRAAAVLAGEAP